MLASLPMTAAGPLLAATLLLAAPQGSPPSREKDATPPPPAPVRVHPLSPRASLQSFLDLCRAGRFGPAAVHLDMDTTPGGAGATAARRLKEVLDRHLWFDMDAVSPEPGGDGDDGLAPDRELLGTIPTPEPEPGDAEGSRALTEQLAIGEFRETTRDARIAIARRAEAAFGRKVSWSVVCGSTRALFTNVSIPVMTRLRIDERQVLDTLVGAGVARSRSDALGWCVRLVAARPADWLGDLRSAIDAVHEVRAQGPDTPD